VEHHVHGLQQGVVEEAEAADRLAAFQVDGIDAVFILFLLQIEHRVPFWVPGFSFVRGVTVYSPPSACC
jgi:hypothetical protein